MKKYTITQKEYAKQIKRIKQAIKRQEKIGFIVPENILPKTPKRITKASVKKLKKITPELIRRKSEYIITENGNEKIVKYSRAKKKVKREIRKLKKQRKDVYNKTQIPYISYISRFKQKIINEIPDERAFYNRQIGTNFVDFSENKNILFSLLDDRIADAGEIEVEKVLKQNENNINNLIDGINHDSNQTNVERDFIEIANIIKGASLLKHEAVAVSEMSEFDYN